MSEAGAEAEAGQSKGVGLRRRQLQCPFTWGIPVVPDDTLAQEYDTLALASDTWSSAVSKLFLSYQLAMRDRLESSRRLLIDCYVPLLEVQGLVDVDSDLTQEYRTALKHVIDSTWAFICCKTHPVQDVGSFIQTITPFRKMTDVQKSAVWGIRGRLAQHQDGLRATEMAISLNPNEGQWHLYRGLLLHQFHLGPKIASIDELRALKDGYLRRPTPETMVVYAIALTALTHLLRRPNDLKRGLELLREAVKRWPNNPYVNFECGVAFHKHLNKQEDFVVAERCLRNAVRLLGPGKCKIAYTELGFFLINNKDLAEGKMYLQMAKEVSHQEYLV